MDVDAVLFIVRKDLKGAPVARQREVARKAKVAWSTLRRAVDGDSNFNVDTIRKLHAYYLGEPTGQHAGQIPYSGPNRRGQLA